VLAGKKKRGRSKRIGHFPFASDRDSFISPVKGGKKGEKGKENGESVAFLPIRKKLS